MSADELFWAKITAIGQVAGAVATFLAVLIALYLARREQSLRIRVSAGLWSIFSEGSVTPVVAVTVDNIGLRKVGITGIGWTTGFFGRIFSILPVLRARSCHQMEDYSWIINKRFPWQLEPGESRSTYFKRDEFLAEFKKAQDNDLFRRLPWLSRHVLLRHRVYTGVYTKRGIVMGKVDLKLTRLLEDNYELNQAS